jgi:hypothetical protein
MDKNKIAQPPKIRRQKLATGETNKKSGAMDPPTSMFILALNDCIAEYFGDRETTMMHRRAGPCASALAQLLQAVPLTSGMIGESCVCRARRISIRHPLFSETGKIMQTSRPMLLLRLNPHQLRVRHSLQKAVPSPFLCIWPTRSHFMVQDIRSHY